MHILIIILLILIFINGLSLILYSKEKSISYLSGIFLAFASVSILLLLHDSFTK